MFEGDEQDLRLHALTLANDKARAGTRAQTIVKRAREYLVFLKEKEEPAAGKVTTLRQVKPEPAAS